MVQSPRLAARALLAFLFLRGSRYLDHLHLHSIELACLRLAPTACALDDCSNFCVGLFDTGEATGQGQTKGIPSRLHQLVKFLICSRFCREPDRRESNDCRDTQHIAVRMHSTRNELRTHHIERNRHPRAALTDPPR